MQRKIRIPEAPGLEPRKPENARYTFLAVDGRMVMVIEMPDGTRAIGRADIERIDIDVTPGGDVVGMLISKDAVWPTRRRGKDLTEMWGQSEEAPADV